MRSRPGARHVTFPRALPAALAFASTLGLGLAVASCGPSFQAIYEGDARFEKCYALDESPNAPLPQKSECWRDWSKRYTYGQTRDRIEYAAARHRALSRVPELPTDEAIMEAAPGAGAPQRSVTAPAPTSAFAPPPGTLVQDGGAHDTGPAFSLPSVSEPFGGAPAAAPEKAPAADCSGGCNEAWHSCGEKCKGAACDVCERDYRRCMRACFKDDAPKKNSRSLPAARPSDER